MWMCRLQQHMARDSQQLQATQQPILGSQLQQWPDQPTPLSSRNRRTAPGTWTLPPHHPNVNISAPSYGNSYGDSLSLGQSNTGYKNSYGQSESQGKSNTSGSSAGEIQHYSSYRRVSRMACHSKSLLLPPILMKALLQGTQVVQLTGPRPMGSGKLGFAWWTPPSSPAPPWKTTWPSELLSSTTIKTLSVPLWPLLSCNPGKNFWKLRSSNTFQFLGSEGVWE